MSITVIAKHKPIAIDQWKLIASNENGYGEYAYTFPNNGVYAVSVNAVDESTSTISIETNTGSVAGSTYSGLSLNFLATVDDGVAIIAYDNSTGQIICEASSTIRIIYSNPASDPATIEITVVKLA